MSDKPSILRQKRFWLSIVISAVFLYLFAKDAPWMEVWEMTRDLLTDPKILVLFIIPSIALNLFSVLVRAWRWRSLLGEPWIPSKRLALYLSIGFMCNNTLPARVGELVRTFLVSKRESRRFTQVFASLVVERVFDLAIVLLILGTILAFVPFPASAPIHAGATVDGEANALDNLKAWGKGFLGLVIAVVAFLSFLVYLPEWAQKVSQAILKPAPAFLSRKVEELLGTFIEGLSTFKRPSSVVWSLLLSVAIWMVIALSEYLLIVAFGIEGVDFWAALVIMVAICLAVAAPQAPGYLGVYHFACSVVCTQVYGVETTVATAFTMLLWATQIIPMSMMGFICLGIAGLQLRDITSKTAEAPEG